MAALASLPVLVLALQAAGSAPPPTTPSAATSARATRATTPPVIDGRDDDEVWRFAPAITQFREFQPHEDGDPRFATEAKVAYDARNLYVFIRALDPHPDSILSLLSRRDVRSASDQLKIIIDSYHDRRTGYEFAVNPAGVKRDYSIFGDGQEDDAWDAVWEVMATIDSLGWTAEFKIPLSQLRFAPGPSITFGFGIWRDIQRFGDRVAWPAYFPSRAGFPSQLGEITGLEGLAPPTRLELSPYVVTKNVSIPTTTSFNREQKITAGADIKYGLTSNVTVNATVNPDFGQVESDPSVLNLTSFETFFQERRPFFIEGTGIFNVSVNCSVVNCNGEGLFYSRRVGRQPQLRFAPGYFDPEAPSASTIIGAAKITGRLPGGLTVGVLDAVTGRAEGAAGRTIEPTTNYGAVRVQQDFRKGESGIGFMGTAVNRDVDQWTEDVLRQQAYVGAADFRHRFAGGRYQVSGSLDFSRVSGTPAAISRTQRNSVHLYQRPDDDLAFDSLRTSLNGDAEEILFGKTGGFIRFETSYQRRSPGFEVNDLGFLLRANQQSWNNWAALNWTNPNKVLRRGFWNFNWWQFWTAQGLPLERAANTNAHFQMKNYWWIHFGGTAGQLGKVFCDVDCARGGPALRLDSYIAPWAGIVGDDRKVVIPELFFNYFRGDGGRSVSLNVNGAAVVRLASRIGASIGGSYTSGRDDRQPYGTFGDTAFTFAHLRRTTASINARVDYTVSPYLSIQLYASPFVSKGTFSNVRELLNPRADRYQDRFQTYGDTAVTNNPGGFNFKQFRSNFVVRWEYRPGSTLFLVWTQGREDPEGAQGTRSVMGDFGRLFNQHPDNTFLVKASYWLSR